MHTIAGSAVVVMALAGCNDQDAAKPEGAAPEPGSHSSAPADPDAPVNDAKPGGGGAEDSVSGGDSGKPGGGSGSGDSGATPSGKKLPPQQIKASTGLPEGHPKEVLVDGATLSIKGQESGCEKASAELGSQSGSQVVVTLVRTQPKEKKMCTMDIRFPPLSVELDDPIGKRTLVLKGESRFE